MITPTDSLLKRDHPVVVSDNTNRKSQKVSFAMKPSWLFTLTRINIADWWEEGVPEDKIRKIINIRG